VGRGRPPSGQGKGSSNALQKQGQEYHGGEPVSASRKTAQCPGHKKKILRVAKFAGEKLVAAGTPGFKLQKNRGPVGRQLRSPGGREENCLGKEREHKAGCNGTATETSETGRGCLRGKRTPLVKENWAKRCSDNGGHVSQEKGAQGFHQAWDGGGPVGDRAGLRRGLMNKTS